MHINFGSIIPIKGVYIVNKEGHVNYSSPVRNPSPHIFQTLTRRINNKKEGYYDKISKLDIDLKKTPYSRSIFDNTGHRYIITGKAAKNYGNVTDEYYRTNSGYTEYDRKIQTIFSKEEYLRDKLNKKVYIDVFVTPNKNNSFEIRNIDMVDYYGKKATVTYPEQNGQLLLPL